MSGYAFGVAGLARGLAQTHPVGRALSFGLSAAWAAWKIWQNVQLMREASRRYGRPPAAIHAPPPVPYKYAPGGWSYLYECTGSTSACFGGQKRHVTFSAHVSGPCARQGGAFSPGWDGPFDANAAMLGQGWYNAPGCTAGYTRFQHWWQRPLPAVVRPPYPPGPPEAWRIPAITSYKPGAEPVPLPVAKPWKDIPGLQDRPPMPMPRPRELVRVVPVPWIRPRPPAGIIVPWPGSIAQPGNPAIPGEQPIDRPAPGLPVPVPVPRPTVPDVIIGGGLPLPGQVIARPSIHFMPGVRAGVAARAAVYARPGPGVKEKKVQVLSFSGLRQRMVGSFGEFGDFLDVFHDALPEHLKAKPKCIQVPNQSKASVDAAIAELYPMRANWVEYRREAFMFGKNGKKKDVVTYDRRVQTRGIRDPRDHVRGRRRRGGRVPQVCRPATPYEKFQAVYKNLEFLDDTKLANGLFYNQVEDFAYGQVGQAFARQSRARGFFAGLLVGPAL